MALRGYESTTHEIANYYKQKWLTACKYHNGQGWLSPRPPHYNTLIVCLFSFFCHSVYYRAPETVHFGPKMLLRLNAVLPGVWAQSRLV